MKNKLLLFLVFISFIGYSQNPLRADYGIKIRGGQPTVSSVNFLTTTDDTSEGLQCKIAPINLPIPYSPVNYSTSNQSIGQHLTGIDTRLGQISSTTAGNTQRVYFTADNTTVTAGTFFSSSLSGKGATASGSPSALILGDNVKGYFNKDLISASFVSPTIAYAGTYSGNLTVSATPTPNATQQRFTVEIYKTNNGGTPIASGVTGAPTGNLGVTVLAILDSGIINLTAGSITNINVSGILIQNTTLNTGERLRYHVSAEKVGIGGGSVTFGVYYGNAYNSYYDVPVAITTDAVINKSGVTGITSTDALNTINSKIPTTYSKIVYVNAATPATATIFDTENPPITNNDLLKNDVSNLYIGTDASNWVYNSVTSTYVTKTISSTTSNFYLQGTTTDAGNSKTANISRTGSLESKSFIKTGSTQNSFLMGNGSDKSIDFDKIINLAPYNLGGNFLENKNIEKSISLNSRKNLFVNSETYTSGNNVVVGSGMTIDNTDNFLFNGVKLSRIKGTAYTSNITLRQAIHTAGKRYLLSFYVKNNNSFNSENRFIWFNTNNSSASGHGARFVDNSVRRVCYMYQAAGATGVYINGVTTEPIGTGASGFLTMAVSKVLQSPYTDLYIGGIQIEEVPDTYVDGVVWMGDSTIQANSGTNNYILSAAVPRFFEAIYNCTSYNVAVAGERLDQMDARWATSVTPLKPNSKYVVIQGGINDIAQGRTLTDMQTSISSMNTKALADGFIPIFLTCTPNGSNNSTQEQQRNDFNTWLKLNFKKVIDINTLVDQDGKVLIATPNNLFENDALHYGVTVRKSIAEFIAKSGFFEFLQPTDYQVTTASYTGKDISLRNLSADQITTSVAPTTSAGGYDVLTRNTATGVTEKVASSNFAIDANALHKTTNETFTGAKSAVNTGTFGVVNGLNLENSGTVDSRVINVLNSNTGIGTYLINSSSGTGSYDTNSSSGVLKIFESSTGSTGDLTRWTKNLVTKAKVDQNGEFTAQKYNLNTGSNSAVGNAVLVGGTISITTTAATVNSIVLLTRKTAGGTIGNLTYTTGVGGITIVSDSVSDTSTVSYLIIN